MEQVLLCGDQNPYHATSTEYNVCQGGADWRVTVWVQGGLISTDGIIKYMRVKLALAPGAGKEVDLTFMLNGAPTALTFKIEDAATFNSNMVNEIDVTGGDRVSLRLNPDVVPTVGELTWSFMFEGDNPGESIILGNSQDNHMAQGGVTYGSVMGSDFLDNVEAWHRQLCPTAGTFKNIYCLMLGSPGAPPDAYKFSLADGGTATALAVTFVAPAEGGSNLVDTFDADPYDRLTLRIDPVDTPTADNASMWGFTFVSDVDGESIVMGGTGLGGDLHPTNTEYVSLAKDEVLDPRDEDEKWQLSQACTVSKLHVRLTASIAGGTSYTFTVRIAAANSNVVAVIDGTSLGDSGGLSDAVALDNYLALQIVPANTPDIVNAYWGAVLYLEPPPLEGGGAGAVVMGTKSLILDLLLEGVID